MDRYSKITALAESKDKLKIILLCTQNAIYVQCGFGENFFLQIPEAGFFKKTFIKGLKIC